MRLVPASVLLVAAGLSLGLYGVFAPPHVQPPLRQAPRAEALRVVGTGRPSGPSHPEAVAHTTSVAGHRVPITPVGIGSGPASVALPALGISSALGPARGLTPDGTIDDAPLSGPDWSLPWWYDAGPAPGQGGSAVILGHVDSALGAGHLGVFFRLGDATPGEAISVTLADGSVTNWKVTSVHLYSDSQFPDALVYDRSGPPTLRLVTCGGAFDYQSHSYQSAVVVTARPASGP